MHSGWRAGTSGTWLAWRMWQGLASPVEESGIPLEGYSASVLSKGAPVSHRKCLYPPSLCSKSASACRIQRVGQVGHRPALEVLKENQQGVRGGLSPGKVPKDGGTGAGLGDRLWSLGLRHSLSLDFRFGSRIQEQEARWAPRMRVSSRT